MKSCAAWYPPDGSWGRDTHICLLEIWHAGEHECACGGSWDGPCRKRHWKDIEMNELVQKIMMIALMVVSGIAALATVGLIIAILTDTKWAVIPAILMAAVSVGSGVGAAYFAEDDDDKKVFNNQIEREVLNRKQRSELKRKRGELVMQRSLVEIEHERDNIVHRQLEASNDPDKPPHDTRFGR